MAADTTSIKCINFGDIVSIAENRANIQGTVQDRDRNLIKGAINEFYIRVCTERNWSWRNFDRAFVFDRAVTTGTVAVTEDSREVTFTGLTLTKPYIGRSFRVTGTEELYRIIGISSSTNSAFLDADYVGDTNATATFKIYQYEFPLPPDCDTIHQLHLDSAYNYYGVGSGEVEYTDNLRFNRALSCGSFEAAPPSMYCKDGKIGNEAFPPLDVMILDYDFLAGDEYTKVNRLRVFPIEPDRKRVLHLNYGIHVEPMAENEDVPIIPVDDRWMLVHHALGIWHKKQGNVSLSGDSFAEANKILKAMRAEHHKTDTPARMMLDGRRGRRIRSRQNRKDIFYASRQGESS